MGFFSKAKNLYSIQKQAKAVKRELKNVHIEAESEGVTVTVTGEQELVAVAIAEDAWNTCKSVEYGKKKLEEAFLKSSNKALKKAQEIAGGKMKGLWKEMGMENPA